MTRLLIVVLVALAAAGAASADTFVVVPQTPARTLASSLPSATAPNADGVPLPQALATPQQSQPLTWDELLPVWQAAGQAYGVPWSVLAAINKVESDFGANMGPSSAGAIGWMQFMPDTWARWGVDANGDGVADPWNAQDAIYSAARYLAASGAATDIAAAVYSYNHAQWYVDEVLQLAAQYANGGTAFANTLDAAQQSLDAARQAVLDANARLLAARSVLDALEARQSALQAAAAAAGSLSDRLALEKSATLVGVRAQAAADDVAAAQSQLDTAQSALDTARTAAAGAAFAPGAAPLLQAPASANGYVFPVAGGAGVVTVGHTHHDFPAADIDAPAGTQLYALSDGTVESSWSSPAGACGIGFVIHTTDGLTWSYCHLSYLEPAVVPGATLTAGQPVGLVGQTGAATGPHLHLQLDPPTGYPQDEPWFQSFAGTAFSWSDSVQSNPANGPVFAVVGDSGAARTLSSASQPVILFTASGG